MIEEEDLKLYSEVLIDLDVLFSGDGPVGVLSGIRDAKHREKLRAAMRDNRRADIRVNPL